MRSRNVEEDFFLDDAFDDEAFDQIRVVAVDDEPDVVSSVVTLMSEFGFEVVGESDPEKAVELVKRYRPDVILLDIMMPGLDGYELAELLGEEGALSDIPIVFLTAKDYHDDACQSFAHGGTLFIKKPFMAQELAETLRIAVSLSRSM